MMAVRLLSPTACVRLYRHEGDGCRSSDAAQQNQQNQQIHHDEDQVVMPPVRAFAPYAGLPNEHLLVDCPKHNEYQPNRSKLWEEAESHAQAAGKFCQPKENGEALTHADGLALLV